MIATKKIGLYGIAANPPTLAHTNVIKSVLKIGILDEIWVIPSFVHFHDKKMVSYDVRFNMCEHAFLMDTEIETLYNDKVKIKRFEATFAELVPDYDGSTISMLENLRKLRDEDYYLIIGQDNANTISSWKNGNMLPITEKFIVLPRQQKLPYNRDTNWYEYPPHIFIQSDEVMDISSTMARKLCNRPTYIHTLPNKEELSKILCGYVMHDIIMNKLYIGGE